MLMIKTPPNYGPSGLASISVVGSQAQIIFDENNEVVNLPLSAFPVPYDKRTMPLNKKYFVSVDGTRSKITALRPASGSPVCEFIGFKRGDNEPIPIPKQPRNLIGKRRDGGEYTKDWLEFTAQCRVIDEVYTGLLIDVKLRYYFMEHEGRTAVKGDGAHSIRIARFLECAFGGKEVRIPYSDNILPTLEAMLQADGQPFMVIMSNGWPDGFGEASSIYLKAKRSKKPAAKKAATKRRK